MTSDLTTTSRQNFAPGAPPNLDDLTDDPRVSQLRDDLAAWLRRYRSMKTRESYAERLGVPRTWIPERPEPSGKGRKPRGYSGTEWLLGCWRNSVPYSEPDADDVNRWLDELDQRGYVQRTQAAWVASASSFYQHLARLGRVDRNPMATVDRRSRELRSSDMAKTRTPLAWDQTRALLEAAWLIAERTRNGPRDRAMIELLVCTGMRAKELVDLDLDSYDRPSPGAGGSVLVSRKGGTLQRLGVPVPTADAVDDYLAERRPGTVARAGERGGRLRQPLFVSSSGERLHPKHVPYLLRRLVDTFVPDTQPRERWKRELLQSQAGTRLAATLAPLKGKASPHRIRHSYGTHALEAGVPQRQVQQDLGHSDPATTEGYLADKHQAENAAGHQLSPALHRGWWTPRTTRDRAQPVSA